MVSDVSPEKFTKMKYNVNRLRKAAHEWWRYPDVQKFLHQFWFAVADKNDVMEEAKALRCDHYDVFIMMLKAENEKDEYSTFVLREWQIINENGIFI